MFLYEENNKEEGKRFLNQSINDSCDESWGDERFAIIL